MVDTYHTSNQIFSSVCQMIRVNICHLIKISDVCNLLQAKVGRWKESESALQRLRGKDFDVYQEATEIRVYNKFLFAL